MKIKKINCMHKKGLLGKILLATIVLNLITIAFDSFVAVQRYLAGPPEGWNMVFMNGTVGIVSIFAILSIIASVAEE